MAPKTNTLAARVRDRWFNTSSCGTVVFSENLTKQEFRDECDINRILARGLAAAARPWQSAPTLRYGEFADAPDFLNAQLLVKASEEAFMALPARVRDRFNHNPVELLRFVHDPKNVEEARALGLAVPPPPAPPPTEPAK